MGVWNFVDASDGGCKATHTGVDEATAVDHDGCYTFDGTGYATQRNIRNYDPRYLSVSMEFRSYDEDALLILLVSDNQVRGSRLIGKIPLVRIRHNFSVQGDPSSR